MKLTVYTSLIVLLITLFTTQNAQARIFPSSVDSAVRENNRVLVKGRDISRNDIVQIEITNP